VRVAVVNSIRVCGGGEKWVARQAACWRARGIEPLILCQPSSGLEGLAREGGLPFEAIVMRHDVSPAAVLGIARALRRFRPDVVLCCNERAFRLAVPATWGAGRPPLVYRNGLTETFKNRTLNRFLFRWARRMIAISEPLRAEMAAYGWIPPARMGIVRNGIDTALYHPNPEARQRVREGVGASPEAVVAAVLARVTEDKGQVETIQALARFAGRRPHAELWIVGEGKLRPRLEALAVEEKVADRVRFLGFRTDVADVLQAVDVVVQASHREGLGNTLLEAMAASRPIVASAVGGILDVVVPGVTGELVPPYAPEALAAALEPLMADADLRRRYGTAGHQRAETEFRLERETDDWCRLFRELAGSAS
jgi:glycosyltransferase involved in cell wall biosynthesis